MKGKQSTFSAALAQKRAEWNGHDMSAVSKIGAVAGVLGMQGSVQELLHILITQSGDAIDSTGKQNLMIYIDANNNITLKTEIESKLREKYNEG